MYPETDCYTKTKIGMSIVDEILFNRQLICNYFVYVSSWPYLNIHLFY